MLKTKLAFLSFAIFALQFIVPAIQAQVPAAPIPQQILAAKKVFISNARGDWNSFHWSGTPERTYNEFYAEIKSWGRYEIVPAPTDADLVLQISLAEPVQVNGGSLVFGSPLFKLALLDPKTGILLWNLDEHLPLDASQKNRDKKFSEGIGNLVGYLKALYIQPAGEAK
jgi:hypothetical protein